MCRVELSSRTPTSVEHVDTSLIRSVGATEPIKQLTRSVPFCTGGRPWTCSLVLITSNGHTNVAAIAPIIIYHNVKPTPFLKSHEKQHKIDQTQNLKKKREILRETH